MVPQTGLDFVPIVFNIKIWNMEVKNMESTHLFNCFGFDNQLSSCGICLEPLV